MTPKIAAIGSIAYQFIKSGGEWRIWGSTSRGCFIGNPTGQILFLTDESYRGPLTINLVEYDQSFQSISSGSPILIDPGRISIPFAGLDLTIDDRAICFTPIPDKFIAIPTQARIRSKNMISKILLNKTHNEKDSLLNWFDFQSPPARSSDRIFYPDNLHQKVLSRICQAISNGQPDQLAAELGHLVGYGRGLTPSGDDFILGVLLVLNRCHFPEWERAVIGNLNNRIILSARKKTTSISACLIECAAAGQADERLILALDYLVSVHDDETAAIEGIKNWGSSSGEDALAGMVTSLDAI